jgi:hypothetical protein
MEEVTKSSLAVMLLLALLVSVVGTITMLKVLDQDVVGDDSVPRESSGNVVISVDRAPMPSYGQVSLSITGGD